MKYVAGVMDLICVAILLLFVFHVKKSVECSYGDIVVSAGFNVSLNWTLLPSSWPTAFFRIYNSLGNETAEYIDGTCNVLDHSTYSCNINKATDPMILSLTIFSVAAIHSGNYTLVPLRGFKEIDNISRNLVVIDGPDNITLSRNESDFYLKENDIFTIDCSANCYPRCMFSWQGHNFFEGKKINISFESRMAGQYTCYVMNQQTNITSRSTSITLHHVKKKETHTEAVMRDAFRKAINALGLATAVLLLVVIGSILVLKWRRMTSNKADPLPVNSQRPGVNLLRPANGAIPPEISRIETTPSPVHNKQETTCRRPYRPTYPSHTRKSRSLHFLLDSAVDIFYPLSGGMSSHLYYSASNAMCRSHNNGIQLYNLIRGSMISNCDEQQLCAVAGKDQITKRNQHKAGVKSKSMINLRHNSFEEVPQENLYNTLAEVADSVYDDPSSNMTKEYTSEDHANDRHGESDYDYADWHLRF